MIEFDKVTKHFNTGHAALSDVSFRLARGEMLFLTGHSGAGKTTVLKLIALMERCTEGQILVNGVNINRMSDHKVPYFRRAIGFIFQQPHLLLERSVFDNVALPLVVAGYEHREIGRRVRAALDKVGLLAKEKFSPKLLSAGEQQRVGIARAIVNKPALVLADEPTGNLDPSLSAEIMQLFTQLNQVGVGMLIASHHLALIKSMEKRIITLKDGTIINDEPRC